MILRLGDETDGLEIDTRNGARLSSLVLGGRERLIGQPFPADVEPALSWGCFLMAPFVGRVSRGRVEWQGERGQLPLNHGRHAIHGVAFDVPWEVVRRTDDSAELTCRPERSRWPFACRLTQHIALSPDSLLLAATIEAGEPMPAALGWHPWFRRDGEMRVAVASEQLLALDEELLPTGKTLAVDGKRDLRGGPCVDGLQLDDAYTRVSSPAIVGWPDLELTLTFEPPIETVVVYTHPMALCVEPQTAWPDAIRLHEEGCQDTGLAGLGAGEHLTASTRWSWRLR
jgi:galactose mutarotase-like enzyme